MPFTEEHIDRIRRIKEKYEEALMGKANVVAVGIGLHRRTTDAAAEPAIVVSVTEKIPRAELAATDVIPRELEGVPVYVEALGPIRAEWGRGERPPSGDQLDQDRPRDNSAAGLTAGEDTG